MYTGRVRIEYSNEAADALDEFEENDAELYAAADEILELLETDSTDRRLRQHLIRPAGAFMIRLYLRSKRSRPYYLLWIPEQEQTVAFIKYVGPGDRFPE